MFEFSRGSLFSVELLILFIQIMPPLCNDFGDFTMVGARTILANKMLLFGSIGKEAVHWTRDMVRIALSDTRASDSSSRRVERHDLEINDVLLFIFG